MPVVSSRPIRGVALFTVLMLMLAAALNAVMDKLQFHYDKSIFARVESQQMWLDPRLSWRNKWMNGDPKQGEAFPLSSTALVATTDAWHCAKSLWIDSILLAVLAPFTCLMRMRWWKWALVFLSAKVLYGAVFETLFAHVLAK